MHSLKRNKNLVRIHITKQQPRVSGVIHKLLTWFLLSSLRLLKRLKQLEPFTLAGKSASSWAILNSINNKTGSVAKLHFLGNSRKIQDFGEWSQKNQGAEDYSSWSPIFCWKLKLFEFAWLKKTQKTKNPHVAGPQHKARLLSTLLPVLTLCD